MLLSYNELKDLVDQGVIKNVLPESINATSIDVRLGMDFLLEDGSRTRVIDLSQREPVHFIQRSGSLTLLPGAFALASTAEIFHLPLDISAQFLLKSTMGRLGLDHMNSTWCDAGWGPSVLTLEIKNSLQHHTLSLREGMFIGQMKFYRHTRVPYDKSYRARGRYNGDLTVTGAKP